jgi:hypothetical protein
MFVLECNIILREDHQVTHITPSPTQVEVEEDGGSIWLSPHSYAIGNFLTCVGWVLRFSYKITTGF